MIDVNGISTRFYEAGKGNPVVLFHGGHYGGNMSAYCWDRNFAWLSRFFHVFAVDKLGMGYTDNPETEKDYTMDSTIDHAYHFLLKNKLKDVSVIGHSRGGFLVTRLAIELPDLIENLVIVDSATLAPDTPGAAGGPGADNFYKKIEDQLPEVPTKESVRIEPKANSYSEEHMTADFIEDRFVIASLPKVREAGKLMSKGLMTNVFLPHLYAKRRETLQLIKSGHLKQSILVVWGMNDPSAPLISGIELFRLISSQNKRSQFHILNFAGHYSYRERPEEFNLTVSVFLKPRLLQT